jgi:hypothetical protein
MDHELVQRLAIVVSRELIMVNIGPHDAFRRRVVKYIEHPDAHRIVERLLRQLDQEGYVIEKKR